MRKTSLAEIRYQYYQSCDKVHIAVLAKNLTPDDVSVLFDETHLTIRIRQEQQQGLFVLQKIYLFDFF